MLRRELSAALFLPLLWGGSCAVFPDDVGSMGAGTLAGAGGDAAPTSAGVPSTAGDGALPEGGTDARGGEGGAVQPSGGAATAGGGGDSGEGGAGAAAGAGGQPESDCAGAVEVVASASLDTWIDQARPSRSYGSDAQLMVVGGSAERRALVEITLPEVPAGAVLLDASLELNLETNADVTHANRRLLLQRLLQPISETKTDWRQFINGGQGDWANEGGDFAPEAGEATVRGTYTGKVSIDAAPALLPVFASQATVSLIVREGAEPPLAPAELAFSARERATAQVPTLKVRYCPP